MNAITPVSAQKAAANRANIRITPVPGTLAAKFPSYDYDYVGTSFGTAVSAAKAFGKFKDPDGKRNRPVVVAHDMGLAFFMAIARSVGARSANGNGSEDIMKYAPAVICVPHNGMDVRHDRSGLEEGMTAYTGTAPHVELNDRSHLLVLDAPEFLNKLAAIANDCKCGRGFGEAFASRFSTPRFEVVRFASIFKTAMADSSVNASEPFYKAIELYGAQPRDMTS